MAPAAAEGELELGVRCVAVGMPGTAPMADQSRARRVRMAGDLVAGAVSALGAVAAQLRHQLA